MLTHVSVDWALLCTNNMSFYEMGITERHGFLQTPFFPCAGTLCAFIVVMDGY